MTGKFMITLRYLREIGACAEGRSAFEKAFPDGGEYQTVLDKCAEEGRMDFASWLLHRNKSMMKICPFALRERLFLKKAQE